MPGTNYTTNLRLANPSLNDTGWGTTVSSGMIDLTDQAIAGLATADVTFGNVTLTIVDGSAGTNSARNMFLNITGTPGVARDVIVPTNRKLYFVTNNCGQIATVKVSGQPGVAVPAGASMTLRINAAGTDVAPTFTYAASFTVGSTLFAPKFAPTGGTATGNGMYLPATNTLAWSTNGVEGIRLDASGNLGVGTNSPTFKLIAANNSTDGGWIYSSSAISVLGLGGYSAPTDGTFQIKYDRATGTTTFNEGARDTPTVVMAFDASGNLSVTGSVSAASMSLTTALPATSGGTGAATLAANNVLLGNGTSAVQTVAPGTAGNLLTSNGTTWISSPAPAGGVTSLNSQTGAVVTTGLGDIGSVAVLMIATNTNVAVGSTVAGSDLRYGWNSNFGAMAYGGLTDFAANRGNSSATYNGGGTSLTGTWRKVSSGNTYFSSGGSYVGIGIVYCGCVPILVSQISSSPYVWAAALYVRVS